MKHVILILLCALCCLCAQAHYLMTYFTGNETHQQQIHFALSDDGLNFTPLNDGLPVIASDSIAMQKAVRDPHILRGNDGWFRMVVTDMDWTKGKWSNHGIVMLRSRDLVNWEHHAVDFQTRYRALPPAEANAVWAPQTIWDPTVGKYMVYFSLHSVKDGPYPSDAVFYAYANEDFSDLESEPKPLFTYPYPTIDTDIVLDDSGLYHCFFNTWGGKEGLQRRQFTFTDFHDQSTWQLLPGHMQPNRIPSEGSCAYPLKEGGWMLFYDCYTSGFCQFCKSDNLIDFALSLTTPTQGTFTPRHGTVIQITPQEAARLQSAFTK